ncbi:MAG TPA: pyruvate, phosphate dikinase [Chloroflexi bacterium]|nr:pyruvate, phosphate dikinase [Chloroflexota bacterium]|tara:strand:+ start:16867 stop:19521 length:2655 start_codon:yes stop_codon:yes gene_type:complete
MTSSDHKWVYAFRDGDDSMRNLLGGKGAGSAEMTKAGMPVPPGFTITTEACLAYFEGNESFPEDLQSQIDAALIDVESQTGKSFGSSDNPLLVSVRSGARVSMPGMMDTVLNLGLNTQTIAGLTKRTGDARFSNDAYRRFVQGFGAIVLGIDSRAFEAVIEAHKEAVQKAEDPELTAEDWETVTAQFKEIIKRESGEVFPDDPREQLTRAVQAVFKSWNGKRAIDYRNFHRLPHDWGTACNVQTMVFGNMGGRSGTGVAFTRDPNDGNPVLYGEYLLNAQGEDVVAGVRTPQPISTLQEAMPSVYEEFQAYAEKLEGHYTEMQDLEFTIEDGQLFMLQTRAGKRSPAAAIRIAVDLVNEGKITKETAVKRVEATQVDAMLHPRIDGTEQINPIAQGLNASPGAASGRVAFTADTAATRAENGDAVILVRPETSPDDFHGMAASQAILTSRGGATSHAAIVARQLGLPAVVGCESLDIDVSAGIFLIDGLEVSDGDILTVDGSTGNVMLGEVPLIPGEVTPELEQLLEWADDIRRLETWANADTPVEAELARSYGAQGIGLCRTEHMFREGDRLPIVQDMILAETEQDRRKSLAQLLPIQRDDFYGILKAMHDLPVVIRLLDPPLHEFLAGVENELAELEARDANAEDLALAKRKVTRANELHEANPMLGLRGCRLGLIYPEVYEMQVRAIIEAALQLKSEGVRARPEIMIPLVSHIAELKTIESGLRETAAAVQRDAGDEIEFKFGTMMEVPRACLTAGEISETAEFLSFGTNDLTQTTFGISRDDAEGRFLLRYVEDGILAENPFQVLDRTGVGALMEIAARAGRAARNDIEIGICGEHGGDPSSIEFCELIGLDYVSASPYRVPVSRIAAAHARLEQEFRDR